jgi:hypothetical protein
VSVCLSTRALYVLAKTTDQALVNAVLECSVNYTFTESSMLNLLSMLVFGKVKMQTFYFYTERFKQYYTPGQNKKELVQSLLQVMIEEYNVKKQQVLTSRSSMYSTTTYSVNSGMTSGVTSSVTSDVTSGVTSGITSSMTSGVTSSVTSFSTTSLNKELFVDGNNVNNIVCNTRTP